MLHGQEYVVNVVIASVNPGKAAFAENRVCKFSQTSISVKLKRAAVGAKPLPQPICAF